MATRPRQNSNPTNTGGAGTIDFNEGSEIRGNIKTPDDVFKSLSETTSPIAFPIADATDLRDSDKEGYGGAVIVLIRWMIQKIKEYLKSSESDMEHMAINYHNHDLPISLPLIPFITDVNIAESHNAPYTTSIISLKIPFEHIQAIFRNAGGRIDPGGFISIRQKSAPTLTDQIDDPKIKSTYYLTHLMTIENINYNIGVDQETGILMTNLQLNCASFIEPLIGGQYVVSETSNIAAPIDDPRFKTSSEELTRRLDILGVPADSPRRQFGRLIQTSQRSTGREGGLISEFFYDGELYNRFLQVVAEGSVTRKNSGEDLKDILTFLGYPKLPTSLTAEYSLERWLTSIEKELDKGAVYYIRLLRTQGVAEDKIQKIGQALLNVFDQVTRNPLNGGPGAFAPRDSLRTREEAPVIENQQVGPFQFQTTQASPGDTTIAAELLRQELSQNNRLNTNGELIEGIEQRIGDVVRVITSTQDLPVEVLNTKSLSQFPWFASLPTNSLFNTNLNKIGNLYSKGQTIWGACVATFQPDNKTHELFPVIIPILDKAWYNAANDYEKKLGGILAVIYRKKPMHPHVGINEQDINSEYLEYSMTFQNKRDRNYYETVKYKTDSEQLGLNQDRRVSIVELINDNNITKQTLSPENVKEYFTQRHGIPVIPYRDVIELNFNHTNGQRVNGVQVRHPFSQTQAGNIGILSTPYINVFDASRYGLRFYQSNYPFMDLSVRENGPINEGNATAERLYMTMGDGSKYSNGNIMIYLETTYGLKQGCWFVIRFTDKANTEFMNEKDDRLNYFMAYCDSISYEFRTNQENGNVQCVSNINYSRGSFGGVIPELPSSKFISFSQQQQTQAITSPGQRRLVALEPIVELASPQQQAAVQRPQPQVRFASDEWGSYNDEDALERRNGAFQNAWAGLSPQEQSVATSTRQEGALTGSYYIDIDGDGFYEWYADPDHNMIYIPVRFRPKVTDMIFVGIEDIVGPGFVAPYPTGYTGVISTVANVNDDYVFDETDSP